MCLGTRPALRMCSYLIFRFSMKCFRRLLTNFFCLVYACNDSLPRSTSFIIPTLPATPLHFFEPFSSPLLYIVSFPDGLGTRLPRSLFSLLPQLMFWYIGKNDKGETGMVPRNFLEPLSTDGTHTHTHTHALTHTCTHTHTHHPLSIAVSLVITSHFDS